MKCAEAFSTCPVCNEDVTSKICISTKEYADIDKIEFIRRSQTSAEEVGESELARYQSQYGTSKSRTEAGREMHEVSVTMSEAMISAHARTEQLERTKEATSELASDSEDFASKAKRIREKLDRQNKSVFF